MTKLRISDCAMAGTESERVLRHTECKMKMKWSWSFINSSEKIDLKLQTLDQPILNGKFSYDLNDPKSNFWINTVICQVYSNSRAFTVMFSQTWSSRKQKRKRKLCRKVKKVFLHTVNETGSGVSASVAINTFSCKSWFQMQLHEN